ncbi:histidine kinase dimerization/phospho-acceptor domain-containing protein [Aestuariibius sp. 2305UL40-4]|uniref:sensor histidine kinase n=1 Tax=Aestuariibius violaceus TaxID=3234132 RepID=UPI00345EEECC
MRFKTKIGIAQAGLATGLGLLLAAMLMSLTAGGDAAREISNSYEQTLAVTSIAKAADDYSEQIAEMFILGPSPSEAEAARDDLLRVVTTMENEVEDELDGLTARRHAAERVLEMEELERIQVMRILIERIEAARTRIETHLRDGRLNDAMVIYRDEIEGNLDQTLDRLVGEAITRETGEVVEALGETAVVAHRMRMVTFALALAALAALVALSIFLYRSVLRPVKALARGAELVAAGNLDHVVAEVERGDELSELTRRFNRMTAQIKAQRTALLGAKADLEHEVDARTEELRDALESLEVQSEGRARFLADISHELRTPLTVVRGKAEVALRDPSTSPEQLRNALERIVRKSADMSRLVDDLLFLARSESGTIPIQRGPVVMQEVLDDTILDSRTLALPKRVSVLPRHPADPVVIHGDADRLRQAILIVLDNAIHAAPPGSNVHVALAVEGEMARVTITDEGTGFTEKEIGEATRRFYHGRSGGAGLGLSIGHWIVEGHDGLIRLANSDSGGAEVSLLVPVGRSA